MSFFNRNDNSQTATVQAPPRRTITPRYQVHENDQAFVVTAFVPGAERSSVETTVEGENLTVLARRANAAPAEWIPLHRESSQADYRLVLELDHRVNRDAVVAELRQGVLTLTVPKAEKVKPRQIEIKG
jgi:HSP20 family molecular chaperone IbpA